MKKTIALQAKILFFFSVFILVLCTVTTVFSVRESLDLATAIFASQGHVLTSQVAAMIDGDRFQALNSSLDEDDPFYEEIRGELYRIWTETTLLYLYTAAPGGDTGYHYVIDGSGEIGSDTF